MEIQYFGTGHKLLKDSKVVIAWNTTAMTIKQTFCIVTLFPQKNYNLKKKDELLLNLKTQNYGYTKKFLRKTGVF